MTAGRLTLVLAALVLAVACDAGTDTSEGRPTGGTTLGTEIKSLDPSGSEIVATGETGGHGATINVGTARLDGEPGDGKPWEELTFYLDSPAKAGCRLFRWTDGTSVPITVVGISFSNDAVRLGPPPGQGRCRPDKPACPDFTFPAAAGDRQPSCSTTITGKPSRGGTVTTVVTFTLRARCTAAAAAPCDDPRIAAARPSPGNPVTAEWSHHETVRTLTHPCRTPSPPEESEDPCGDDNSSTTTNHDDDHHHHGLHHTTGLDVGHHSAPDHVFPAMTAGSSPSLLDRVQSFAAVAAPTTVGTALLLYFGYVSTLTRYQHFGIDLGALDLSTTELLLLGTEVIFPPLAALLILLVVGLLAHRGAQALVARHRRPAKVVAVVVMLVGAAAFVRAAVGVLDVEVSRHELPGLTAVCLGAGLPLLAYGAWTYRRAGPRGGKADVVLLTALTGLVVLGLFWGTNIFAGAYGRGRAEQLVAELHTRPVVILDLQEPLGLPADLEGVQQWRVPAEDASFRFRCQGLRLLTEAGGRLFLVPEHWDRNRRTIVVPYDSSVRVQFVPG